MEINPFMSRWEKSVIYRRLAIKNIQNARVARNYMEWDWMQRELDEYELNRFKSRKFAQ